MKEYLFTQSITHNNVDLELDFLKSNTLTMKLNSLAPVAILRLLNPHNTLVEDMGIEAFDELKIKFMDLYSEDDGDVMDFVVVYIHPDKNPNILMLECMEKNAYRLSQKDTEIFHRMSVPAILKKLTPDLEIDCGRFQIGLQSQKTQIVGQH